MTRAMNIIGSYSVRAIGRAPTADDTFRDLGLDCIDRTCIALEVEELIGRDLGDDEIERWSSVADVLALVEGECR